MKVGVVREIGEGENRVGLVPETAAKLTTDGFEVLVETGAGRDYNLDEAYEAAGGQIVSGPQDVYEESDVVVKVQRPTDDEVGMMRPGTTLVCFLNGPVYPGLVKRLAEAGVTVFSVEAIPRISRAQSMDALSAMGSLSGYKCAVIAADLLGKYFPMMTTAAGTTRAAKVLVLGAGVAGLQAVATAKRLGAEVSAFDIRPEVKEQVESLGATFLDSSEGQRTRPKTTYRQYEPKGFARLMVALGFNSFAEPPKKKSGASVRVSTEAESMKQTGGYAREQSEEKQRADRELMRRSLGETDVVITTALVPGRKAPILLTQALVEEMGPGSVVVDLAAENGGNCELTEPGETVEHEQVRIFGPVNVPSSVPIHASQLYSRNMLSLLRHLTEDGELKLDFEDEITAGACLAHDGEIRHEPTLEALQGEEAR